jgi:hypothetical protein
MFNCGFSLRLFLMPPAPPNITFGARGSSDIPGCHVNPSPPAVTVLWRDEGGLALSLRAVFRTVHSGNSGLVADSLKFCFGLTWVVSYRLSTNWEIELWGSCFCLGQLCMEDLLD